MRGPYVVQEVWPLEKAGGREAVWREAMEWGLFLVETVDHLGGSWSLNLEAVREGQEWCLTWLAAVGERGKRSKAKEEGV
jgi:hypothetical protein